MTIRMRGLLGTFILALLLCSTASGLTIVNDGTAVIDDPVSCGAHKGRVVVRTGVHFQEREKDFRDGISLSFQATQGDALACCWVQFTWSEVIATVQSGGATVQGRVNGTLPTSGGPVKLTTNPATPSWHVDSAGASPCYESAGLGFKDQRGATIFDRPDNVAAALAPGLVASLAPATVTHIKASIHFEAYLICNRTVCHMVSWNVDYTWTPAPGGMGPPTLTGPTFTPAPSGRAGGAIRPEQKQAGTAEHPGATVLPP